jgi:hypothetical protein
MQNNRERSAELAAAPGSACGSWVPVNDALPDPLLRVLCWDRIMERPLVAWRQDKEDWCWVVGSSGVARDCITHWAIIITPNADLSHADNAHKQQENSHGK